MTTTNKLRFTQQADGTPYPDWTETTFNNVFISVPTKNHQINTTQFMKNGDYPVIDQSQNYIAGYSNDVEKIYSDIPVIVFGDHTTILKYIDFTFIVGADGTKILKTDKNNNLKYLYHYLEFNNIESEGYKRHFSILRTLPIVLPCLEEQERIASLLSTVDEMIDTKSQELDLRRTYKQAMMQRLFSQEVRFTQQGGTPYPDWTETTLGAVLDYEQPTDYIVDTDIEDKGETPVLTANKSFILGYTNETYGINENYPLIIFDDFTTDNKYVDFPFKVKSSAMKILNAKGGNNIKCIYEILQMIEFEVGGHKRHYISEFQHLPISLPCLEEQERIASLLSTVDEQVDTTQNELHALQQHKKALMQRVL